MATNPTPDATFDPAAWLARYAEAGGWWTLTPDRLWFGWPVETFDAAMAVREVYCDVEKRPDRMAMIRDHLGREDA